MGTHMKTTIELPPDLLKEAKRVAATERITLRSLIEEGLRHVLARRRRRGDRFVLREASYRGKGTHDGVDEGDWESIRARIYDGRGG